MPDIYIGDHVWITAENRSGLVVEINEYGYDEYYLIQYDDNKDEFTEKFAWELQRVHAR